MPSSPAATQPSPAPRGHLLVCLMADGQAPELVRQGRLLHQAHQAQGGTWSVVGIETPEPGDGSHYEVLSLLEALHEAERDGARTHRISVDSGFRHDVLAALVQQTLDAGATALLIGRPHCRPPTSLASPRA